MKLAVICLSRLFSTLCWKSDYIQTGNGICLKQHYIKIELAINTFVLFFIIIWQLYVSILKHNCRQSIFIRCHCSLRICQYCNPEWINFSVPQINPRLWWHWHQSCHLFSAGYPLLGRSSFLGSSPYPELRQLSRSQQLKSPSIHTHFHSLIGHATAVLFHHIHHQGWTVVHNTVWNNSVKACSIITRFPLFIFTLIILLFICI